MFSDERLRLMILQESRMQIFTVVGRGKLVDIEEDDVELERASLALLFNLVASEMNDFPPAYLHDRMGDD